MVDPAVSGRSTWRKCLRRGTLQVASGERRALSRMLRVDARRRDTLRGSRARFASYMLLAWTAPGSSFA